ncbi:MULTISPECIES: class I SAM-dependent methyltransferase [Halorussus]|uniref:class I SAM-dependent methyltransferase n=1 Tax=Halorussus TaxID=1070314 RepID=UPI000E21AC47|nr:MULTISPECIES: class I SAM-dependent methyltransferase [Halorussus]NHN58046.1 class I SAM-dependent methyltransferase [Halorussus sp. JP-T4]
MKKPGEVFADASLYDPGIEAIVPRYDELHDAVLNAPPHDRSEEIRVLELGAGTGELTTKLLTRFPQSSVLAVDHSDQMLDEAERKLETFGDRATLERGAFPDDYPTVEGEYDLVVSSLAVHHLDEDAKRELFDAVFASLAPGGWFINGDVVEFDAPHLETLAGEMIENWVRSKGWHEEAFMDEWEASDDYDDPSTLTDQLVWLREAGFEAVTSVWQYYNFAVYAGGNPEG